MEHREKLISWGSDIEEATIQQALKAARLSIVHDHIALMPDAHIGIGATVGSVIPTLDAVIPSAVGVDIGCGMAALKTDLKAHDLPDSLEPLLDALLDVVPAGVGKGHEPRSESLRAAARWLGEHPCELTDRQAKAAYQQLGSLGSGNHFWELCLDQDESVWILLHSGSRGVGNQLAQSHIKKARSLAHQLDERLEDPDLAYFMSHQPEFQAYISDMLWAQDYAAANRKLMLDASMRAFVLFMGRNVEQLDLINCHHNFTQQEEWWGQRLWITRKGAIEARQGMRGLIPGSMGTRSYVVKGLGNELAWHSCSHGAGRRHSRSQAKRLFTTQDLEQAMAGKTWLADKADHLLDEIPQAYKDIDQVMQDQKDLVEVEYTLTQILNYKGA